MMRRQGMVSDSEKMGSRPSLQPFRKTLSTCDLMQWKIRKIEKIEKSSLGLFVTFLSVQHPSDGPCQLEMYPIACIQGIEFFRHNLKLKRYEGLTDGQLKQGGFSRRIRDINYPRVVVTVPGHVVGQPNPFVELSNNQGSLPQINSSIQKKNVLRINQH